MCNMPRESRCISNWPNKSARFNATNCELSCGEIVRTKFVRFDSFSMCIILHMHSVKHIDCLINFSPREVDE